MTPAEMYYYDLKGYLCRPHGFKETYPRPEGRAYTEG